MQQLLRMTRSILIFATIISLTLAVPEVRLRKCCPEGMVLSFLKELNCTTPEKYTTELIGMGRKIADHEIGFPNCKHPEDVNIVHLSTLNTTDSLQASSCIEIMQGRFTNESTLIAVNCRHLENDSVEESEQLKAPLQLLRFSICEDNMYFSRMYPHRYMFLSLLPEVPFHFVEVSKASKDFCERGILITYLIRIDDIELKNGSLWVTIWEYGTPYSIPAFINNSCLDVNMGPLPTRILFFQVCKTESTCQKSICVFNYCPGQRIHSNMLKCSNGNLFPAPSDFHDALPKRTDTAWNEPGFGFSYAYHCPSLRYINSSEAYSLTWAERNALFLKSRLHYEDKWHCTNVFDNGSALYMICLSKDIPDINTIGSTLDIVRRFLPSSSKLLLGLEPDPRIVFQSPKRTRKEQLISQRYEIISFLDAISCVSLLLTLMVYLCLPFLQNLHGKTLMCNAASLLVSYTCQVIIIWVTTPPCCLRDGCMCKSCAPLGYIMLFSWLSAYSWLNVVCFDIWLTFGNLCQNRSGGHSEGKRFQLYSIYAWGLPLFITLFCVASDLLTFLPDSITPYIGLFGCWFNPNTIAEIIFFQLPLGIQLTSNVVFLILTSKYCSKVKAEIRRMADDTSDTRSKRFRVDKARLIMNVKLFMVMGIMWIAEIASFLSSTCDTCQWVETEFYWLDPINRLHGLTILILFVLKPRVYIALQERLRLWRGEEGIQLRDVHDSRPDQSAEDR